ncbi:hypothetical protein POF50_012045 [Streptomyces sp. SL13]|uniref:ATP-grasp domain-containing protein n=1 Tax=Streptantibioticus silvisoli TaxID=2705255 RepID=A0AA90K8H5_9ACTN|nr:hypothetical protein [Streptantibioticus silvisoli]MDI5963974.1 hypothetical protein [Streptantibioticus silvisoli]MDI5970063.1 hypothetical protein [Streptantibioticus silvisoli]
MTVLVVAVGPPVLEQELVRAGHTDFVSVVPEAYAGLRGDGHPVVPVRSLDDYAALAAVARAHPGAGAVLTVQEEGMRAAAFLRDLLGLPGAGLGEAVRFTDKTLMKRLLAAAGLPVAANTRVASLDAVPAAAELIGWPVVVKPAAGGGTENVWRADGPAHLERLAAEGHLAPLSACGSLVVEAFVDVRTEYHCDALHVGGREVYAHVGRYPAPLLAGLGATGGTTLLPDTDPVAAAVLDLHRASLRALGQTDGFTHGEFFGTPDGLMVGEVAARPGGAGLPRALFHQYGIDVRAWAVDLALDRPLRPVGGARADVISWLTLPARPGRIHHVSSAKDLRELPGVIEAVMRYGPGDLFDRPRSSIAYAGHVYLASTSPEEATTDIERVLAAYRFELDTDA